MKSLSDLLFALTMFFGIVLMIEPLIYWLAHPELTYMQMFLNRWVNYAVVLGAIVVTIIVDILSNAE